MSVGVVVPNLNYGPLLDQALQSVRAQTVRPSDVVVVDGGSTDESRDVAAAHGARWMSDAPGSIGRARNVGIMTLATEFIVPLDSDDWIEPTFIERCLEKMADPSVGAVGTGLVYQPGGNVQWPDEPLTTERLMSANRMFTCSMFRRAAWESVGGYDEYPDTYEDWELWLNMTIHGWKLVVVREPLFNHRLHAGSHTTSRGVRNPAYIQHILKKHVPCAIKEL
jgi:glycosyltransferase involved in cell wall biosynthesis